MACYIDIRCGECGGEFPDVRVEVEGMKYTTLHVCPDCGGEARRVVSVPAVTGKAATRDGAPRAGFADLKKNLDLQIESYKLPASERGEINKEIAARKKSAQAAITRKGKDYDAN